MIVCDVNPVYRIHRQNNKAKNPDPHQLISILRKCQSDYSGSTSYEHQKYYL